MLEEKRELSSAKEARIDEILDRLERLANEAPATAGVRRERKWRYRRPNIIANVEHPGGGLSKLNTQPVALSCDGIVLLFSGFTYPGSNCNVILVAKDGESISTRGVVVSCKHVERVLHCAEIKFSQRIDPHVFIESQRDGGEAVAQLDLPNLHGKVMYLDDSESDAKLLAHYLRGSNIELKAVKTPEEAFEAVTSTMFDIVLCDLNLGDGHDSIAAIREIRKRDFQGPIVIVSADNSPERLSAAKAAGAEHVLTKPYARNLLVQIMIKLHQEVGAITAGEVLYSTLSDQADTEDLIADYIKATAEIARKVQEAIANRDLKVIRELCLNLKGSASGYGFVPLGLAAEEALRSLDSTMSIDEAKPKLRMLTLSCLHLGLRKNVAVA